MSSTSVSGLEAFQWKRQPGAEAVVRGLVEEFLQRCEVGARLVDGVDFVVGNERGVEEKLQETGFLLEQEEGAVRVYKNPEGILPRVGVSGDVMRVGIKVDSVADFLAANGGKAEIEGTPFGVMRRAVVGRGDGVMLEVVERRGWT